MNGYSIKCKIINTRTVNGQAIKYTIYHKSKKLKCIKSLFISNTYPMSVCVYIARHYLAKHHKCKTPPLKKVDKLAEAIYTNNSIVKTGEIPFTMFNKLKRESRLKETLGL